MWGNSHWDKAQQNVTVHKHSIFPSDRQEKKKTKQHYASLRGSSAGFSGSSVEFTLHQEPAKVLQTRMLQETQAGMREIDLRVLTSFVRVPFFPLLWQNEIFLLF